MRCQKHSQINISITTKRIYTYLKTAILAQALGGRADSLLIATANERVDTPRRIIAIGVPLFQRYLTLQEEYYALKELCSEQERTLEELGGQLSAAKLAAAELREAADNAQQQSALQEGSVTWANDRLVTQCKGCSREFNMTRRKVIKLFNCPHAYVILFLSSLSL